MNSRATTDWHLYGRILAMARPYWTHCILICVISMLAAPIAILLPLPLKIVVDSVLGSTELPPWLSKVFPAGWVTDKSALLMIAVMLVVVIALAQQIQGFSSWLLQLYTGEKLVLTFRGKLFQHLQKLSLTYHDRKGTADSLYRIQYDAQSVQYVVINGFAPFLTACVTLVALIWVTACIDWQLALIALAISPALFALSEIYRRRIRDRWSGIKTLESSAMSVIQEVLSSIRVVKAFAQEEREGHRFADRSSQTMRAQLRVVCLESAFGLSIALTIAGGTAAVLWVGVSHVQAGMLTLGELLMITAYIAQLFKPLETISKKMTDMQSSLASAERAFSLLNEPQEVIEAAHPLPLRRARGEVAFDQVSFSYHDEREVLHDVSFTVPAGARVGISGETGSGKTTIISLLPRFFDPTQGSIILDGIDLRAYRLKDLRQQFAIVLQDSVLFSTSIAENIAYGRVAATEREIVEAAKAANIHEFIVRLPRGYQTPVGERGMMLSGGERQRVALARAFLKNAPILILDEPTSSVDVASEAAIMDAMERLAQDRTTFMIAHRLSTLDYCDIRLHVQGGRLEQWQPSEAVTSARAGV